MTIKIVILRSYPRHRTSLYPNLALDKGTDYFFHRPSAASDLTESISSNLAKEPEQLPKTTAPSRPLQPYNGVNRAQPASAPEQAPYKASSELQSLHGVPIHIPTNKDLPNSGSSMRPPTFDYERAIATQSRPQPQAQPRQHPPSQSQQTQRTAAIPGQAVYIPTAGSSNAENDDMTVAETEKALRDLISGNMNDEEEQGIDAEDKIVEGFKDGIKLLDHQVIGRKWMAGREDLDMKRYGGILADDMGYALCGWS